MLKNERQSEITIYDLHDSYRWLAELIGLDKLLLLVDETGGSPLYIPQMKNLIKTGKYTDIMEEFDGYNIKFLIKKYKVSESTVRRLVGDKIKAKRAAPFEGQTSLFN